jgi:hypothetical protein
MSNDFRPRGIIYGMNGDSNNITRGEFFRRLAGAAILIVLRPVAVAGMRPGLKHPDPRPGVTSEKVLPADKLPANPKVRSAYAAARANPAIFDGLACACGCSDEHRSLLVCYETAQPEGCWSCRDEAVAVGNAIAAKSTLAEIRALVDKKF